MYSPRQRDLRERRIHQRPEDHQVAIEVASGDPDEGQDFDASPWVLHLTARASAA
jgi:hypothetical protein